MNKVEATKLKEAFDKDGVVVIRNFITQQELDEICDKAEILTRKLPKRSDNFSNVTKGLDRMDSYFNDLLHKGPQVAILEMLLGEKPRPTTASIFTKNKHSQEVHPHSDAMKGGVVWLAIDETNIDNGCLQFLKGSDQREEEFAHLSASKPIDLSDHPDRFECAMNPGDIAFFRPTTVHWSGPNQEGTIRRGLNYFYVGDPFEGLKGRYTKDEWTALKNNL